MEGLEIQTSFKKFKELSSAQNEKSIYYNRILLMNNRIKTIIQKNQEEQIKIKVMKSKQKNKENFSKFKDNNKKIILENRSFSDKILLAKKEQVQNEKKLIHKNLEIAKKLNENKKKKLFNEIRDEKKCLKDTITQYNNHNLNVNKFKCIKEKLKQARSKEERERNKINANIITNKVYNEKINKEKKETERLKNELKTLEKLEEKYLEDLNKTVDIKVRTIRNNNNYNTPKKRLIKSNTYCKLIQTNTTKDTVPKNNIDLNYTKNSFIDTNNNCTWNDINSNIKYSFNSNIKTCDNTYKNDNNMERNKLFVRKKKVLRDNNFKLISNRRNNITINSELEIFDKKSLNKIFSSLY